MSEELKKKKRSIVKREKREKIKEDKRNGVYGWTAHLRYIRIAPRKVRYIANELRGKSYLEVLGILKNMPHKGAFLLKKTLVSSASNAMSLNEELDEESLYVKDIMVNEGPRIKRIWRRGKGKADTLLKRTSHISVTVDKKQGDA